MNRRLPLYWAVLIVFVVALALRLGHLAGLQSSFEGTHLFSLARGDAAHHWGEATRILDEGVWLRDRVAWKGPGYSYVLAGLMWVAGRSPAALRWPLALLGALNCAGLVLLARRLLPTGWCAGAGMLAAANGVLILFDGELLFPTVLIALSLGVLLLLTRPQAGLPSHAAAGLLTGLSALIHPVYLLPGAALVLWLARRGTRKAFCFAIAIAAAVVPLGLSNLAVHEQPVLISWNGGINLYVGNQAAFDQYSGNRTNAWIRVLHSPVDAGIESEYERDRLYYRLALRQALGAPLEAALILLKKAAILFSPVEYASNLGLYELRAHSPVLALALGRWGPLWIPFGVLGPLLVLGLGLTLRRPVHPAAAALALWSAGLAATIVLSFNTSRYRAPLVFFGCIWAAVALHAAVQAWREGRRGRLALGAGAGLLLAAVMAGAAVPQRGFPLPLEWDEAMARASPARAEPWVLRALERAPDDAPLRYAAAGFYARQGRREDERRYLNEMLAMGGLEPDLVSIGRQLLARSLALDGRIDEARAEIRAAIDVGVDDTTWRGLPYYPLGLGPVTACRLRLESAENELIAGQVSRAVDEIRRVREECAIGGPLRERLIELEARTVVARPRVAPGR